MRERVLARAPAKLNLALSVGGPDASGMHPIASWMVTVDLMDEMELLALPPGSLSRFATIWHDDALRKADIDWSFQHDLPARAHRLLEARVERPLHVQSTLRKRIPLGGGVGGGSSDAAAMLLALNDLFELGLSLQDLAEVGREVGSDVPFLIHGGSGIVEGVGEQVEPRDEPPSLHAVLAFPESGCPTAEVYRRFDDLQAGSELDADRVRMVAGALTPENPFNDLAEPAYDLFPDLRKASEALSSLAERPAHLSGSGSTLYVLCDDPLHAEHLAMAASEQLDLASVPVSSVSGVALERPNLENT
ncbi:MAG: 4-(cytidine 5'-diphospho)-2-C-methyl-D-erythritol kinase [Phycisphaerales bacterium]|nr:4-(cytidine 5'-diphospho)-2-C-methyl-D-erythritol kinase [Phycisphaerales bacterium]